jgi:spoIIIJ-associated protein
MEKDRVADLIRELIAKMGMTLDGLDVADIAGHTLYTLRTKDSGALIGAGGDTLHALNHIVKKFLETKDAEDSFRFVVDVNGYHLKHIKMLEIQAKTLAERARTFKYDIEMSPMSPYDRMIIHAALQGAPNVKTESFGEGPTRHIVVKYIADGQAPSEPVAEKGPESFA